MIKWISPILMMKIKLILINVNVMKDDVNVKEIQLNIFFYCHFFLFFSLIEEEHFKRQTQVVQRNLPRPNDVNLTILRPANAEGPMNDFQKVELLLIFVFNK